MIRHIALLALCLFSVTVFGQGNKKETISSKPDPAQKLLTVEAACGECQFGMAGKGCDLAIRYDGHSYYVDGTNINSHGDAHGADGFCEAISNAEVQGKILNGRFQATYFKVLKSKAEPEKAK